MTAAPAAALLAGKYRIELNAFHPCDWCSLFNGTRFFELHRNAGDLYFQLCIGEPAQVVGVVHFGMVEPGHYRSPRRGTFGSFEFREPLRMEAIEGFVLEVERILHEQGADVIELLEPPAILDPSRNLGQYSRTVCHSDSSVGCINCLRL